jgi:hypothetical protein
MRKFFLLLPALAIAQQQPETLRQIHDQALTKSMCYDWLGHLTKEIGPRLSGSANAEKAVAYTKSELEKFHADRVYLQPVMVPHWERGEKETAWILDGKKKITVAVCALGNTVATPDGGLTAPVIEVSSLDELKAAGDKVKGKIVFFDKPMPQENIDAFVSYSQTASIRWAWPSEAAKLGAIGTICRSLSMREDNFPHTGSMGYGDLPKEKYIPAAAISTSAATMLSEMMKKDPALQFHFEQHCRMLPDAPSNNVIAEIRGSEHPEQIMTVGGHLDSWDLAQGAQDDGAGVTQSMEVLRIFNAIGYRPKHTLRIVLFMNEENGGRGGKGYNAAAKAAGEDHIFALESDCGGFSPRGFTFEVSDADFEKMQALKPQLEPFLIGQFTRGHAGTDIGPLESKHIVKAGLYPDTQRYFDYHHAANDTFDVVNKRELELGAAAMASLVYLIDQQGIE